MATGTVDSLGVIGIGLVHALALTAIVYAIGYRSGSQVNPAVTIGLLVAGKLGGREAVLYIGSQILGAVIGRSCSLRHFWFFYGCGQCDTTCRW